MSKESRKLSLARTLGLVTVTSLILGTSPGFSQSPGGAAATPHTNVDTDAKSGTDAKSVTDAVNDAITGAATKNGGTDTAVTGTATKNVGTDASVTGTVDGIDPAKVAATLANNNALDHYELAHSYLNKFDTKMTELELEVALMYVPTMKMAHRDYCLVSLLRGHPLRAIAEFMMVVGLGEPIPLNQAEREELTARGAKAHYRKGLEYGLSRNWDNALSEFKLAQEYAPHNAAIIRSLAFCYASLGDFDKAETAYARSFALDPSDPYGHADFAYILSEHGQTGRAVDQLSRAIKLDPKAAALHVDMAWMAEAKGDLNTAETEFHQAVVLSPKHAGLWSHLGRVEERLGKAVAAKSAYAQALALDPSMDEARKYLNGLKNCDRDRNDQNSGKQTKKSS